MATKPKRAPAKPRAKPPSDPRNSSAYQLGLAEGRRQGEFDEQARGYKPKRKEPTRRPEKKPFELPPERSRAPEEMWLRVRDSENLYGNRLKKLAKKIQDVVAAEYDPKDPAGSDARLQRVLNLMSRNIEPWARAAGEKMVADVDERDRKAWKKRHGIVVEQPEILSASPRRAEILAKRIGQVGHTRYFGPRIQGEIAGTPVGALLQETLERQVGLIKSLPEGAAARIHRMALSGKKLHTIAREILKTGQVTEARAKLIARTEVARVASGLVEARARTVGSTHYIWRTVGDSRVRNTNGNPIGSHRLLNGRRIAWDSPPVASTRGDRYHAGCGPNCRCHPDPIL